MSRLEDEGGEYSLGRGPKPERDPAGRPIPRTASEEAMELRRAGLRDRAGDKPQNR